jgi:WD40 repeat protein
MEMEFVGGRYPDLLVAGTDDTGLPKGKGVVQVWCLETREIIHTFQECVGHVSCLSVNGDGNVLLYGSADRMCRLADLRTNSHVSQFKTFLEGDLDINVVSFSPCERYITSSGEDNQTLVFDRRTNSLLHLLSHTRPAAHLAPQGVTSVKWVPNSSVLISGGEDGVNLWDINSGSPLMASHRSHSAPVSCLDYSDNIFVSGGDDQVVNIYSTAPKSFSLY